MRIKRQGWVTTRIEKIKEENVCIHIFIGGGRISAVINVPLSKENFSPKYYHRLIISTDRMKKKKSIV